MAQLKGDDLVLYAYEDLEPIGCEDSFILNKCDERQIIRINGI